MPLVVSGPVVITKDSSNTAPQFAAFPQAIERLGKIRYNCSDDAVVSILDTDASADALTTGTTLRVKNAAGTVVDTEANLSFSGSSHNFSSDPLTVRLIPGATGTAGNGILEGDTGYTVEATYVDATAGSRTVFARAPMDCEPNFLAGQFVNPGTPELAGPGVRRLRPRPVLRRQRAGDLLGGAHELVSRRRVHRRRGHPASLFPVPWSGSTCGTATLPSAVHPGLAQEHRPDSGRAADGGHLHDQGLARVRLGQGNKVFLRLTLANTSAGKVLGRLTYNFTHAMGADRESLHYSTDYPTGSASPVERDLDRNLIIDPNDRPGLTLGQLDETVTFSSLFTPLAAGSGPAIHNVICTGLNTPIAGCPGADEVYPALGIFDAASDTNTNGIVDRHILSDNLPAGTDLIPWNFDSNDGGWTTQRDAGSIIGASTATLPVWHWVQNGTCGFQTQSKTNCIIPGTCTIGGAACFQNSDCAGGVNGPCIGSGTPGNDPDGPGALAPCAGA